MTPPPRSADIPAALAALAAPFPLSEVRVRPGAVNYAGTRAMVLPDADWWSSYLPRLDAIIGPGNWQIMLRPWGADRLIAHLSAFGGLLQGTATGECAPGAPLGGTCAEAQAKQRVCAEVLGLGRFLYRLPAIWGNGAGGRSHFAFHAGEAERCLAELYRRAGLLPPSPPPATPATAPPATIPRPTPRQAQARAALAAAERRQGVRPSTMVAAPAGAAATDAQIRTILHVVAEHPAPPATLDALGQRFGIAALTACTAPSDLRAASLSRRQASDLISALARLMPRQAP